MTTRRANQAGWAVPATISVVAAGASAAVTWAALVPPAVATAPAAPPPSVPTISRSDQQAVEQAAQELKRARRHLHALIRLRLPVVPGTTSAGAPAPQRVSGGAPAPAPAPVYVAPAPPPVQTTTGASGATH